MAKRNIRPNRPPLIAYRLRRLRESEAGRNIARHLQLLRILEQVLEQQSVLLEEQSRLVQEHQALLRLLLRREV